MVEYEIVYKDSTVEPLPKRRAGNYYPNDNKISGVTDFDLEYLVDCSQKNLPIIITESPVSNKVVKIIPMQNIKNFRIKER